MLWDLTASLEPKIDEVFSGDGYTDVVARSRAEVRDSPAQSPSARR